MKTKIVYVLVSSKKDFFWEQCLISVMSVRHHMPEAHTVLVCDTETKESLYDDIRNQISQYFSEIIAIPFENYVEKTKRSRILKVSLRNIVIGDFLYVDCDTLITQPLYEIDSFPYTIAAVLDGHCPFKCNPMREFFLLQNKHLNYPLDKIYKYYNGGVMYVKDTDEAYLFYNLWHKNYLISCEKGVYIDEPALSMTNVEQNDTIQEIEGTWNCQIRFGALYLATNKILHFCSKKNMPVSYLSNKNYLNKIKAEGVNTIGLLEYISDWEKSIPQGIVTCVGYDASFAVSPMYETQRKHFLNQDTRQSLYCPLLGFSEIIKKLRNNLLGRLSSKYLSRLLYKEMFCKDISNVADTDFNKMLHVLAFNSDIREWSILADKLEVRDYIKSKGLSNILPIIYNVWDNVDSIDIETLPFQYVLKCNHDNGSVVVVYDNYSIDKSFITRFYKKKLRSSFGIETAEPHYKHIPHRIFAEELLQNDKCYSDSLVSYKFFSFYGKADYCQVIYDSKHHKNQKSIIYKTCGWKKQKGFVLNNEGNIDIPSPCTIKEMKQVVNSLTAHLPFCRVDLYECNNRVYFSEMTFMPGAGRIKGFSQEFLDILGNELNKTKQLWIQ